MAAPSFILFVEMPHEPKYKYLGVVVSSNVAELERGAIEFELPEQGPIWREHVSGPCKQIKPVAQMEIRFAGQRTIHKKHSVSHATIGLKYLAHGG